MKTTLLLLFFLYISSPTNAQQTYVPDDAFEQRLMFLGLDDEMDNYVLTANINMVTSLDVFQQGISDLTGIEDFTALEELWCGYNQLTSLDLSQNTALTNLFCADNQLVSLNISQCILLEELEVGFNQLTTLDISQNVNLVKLLCSNNNLAVLNVTQNTSLEILECGENQLESLDVTQNILLESLSCSNNQIISLDVSQCILLGSLMAYSNSLSNMDLTQNTALEIIWIRDNQLALLDIRNGTNTIIQTFKVQNNPNLTCIFVDDLSYSQNNPNWEEDSTVHYVETQQQCDDLAAVTDFYSKEIKIYPNPVKNFFHIKSGSWSIYGSKLILVNLLGEKIYQATITAQKPKINVSHLKTGMYFLILQNKQNQLLTKKIIKL